jgi:hypothetical protein
VTLSTSTSSVLVTNTGTQHDAAFNFVIPMGFTGSIGNFSVAIQELSEQTGTNYTLALSDIGELVRLNNTQQITVTVPLENSVAFLIGHRIDLQQLNIGGVIVQGAAGVVINSTEYPILNNQFSIGTLIKTGSNEWSFVTPQATGYSGSVGYVGSQGAGYVGSAGYTGSIGGFNSIQELNAQTGTAYTLVINDAGELVRLNNTQQITVTVPLESSVAFSIGQRIDVQQLNIGGVIVQGDTGVIINSTEYPILNNQFSIGTLIKTGSNEWNFVTPSGTGFSGSVGYVGSQGAGYVGSAGYTGSIGGFNSVQELLALTATNYTFSLIDAGDLVRMNTTQQSTVTIPLESSVAFSIGQRIDIQQVNIGPVILVGAAGVTLVSTDYPILNSQFSVATVIKTGSNEWLFIGPQGTGYTGSQGVIGFTGSTGTQGLIGFTGSTGTQGLLGGFNSVQSINTQSGVTYSLVLTDAGNLITLTNNAGCAVTIPPDSSVNFAIGQRIDLLQESQGSVGVIAGSGVTLYSTDSPILNSQYSIGTLIKIDANEWTFAGPATSYIGYTGSTGYVGSQGNSSTITLGVITISTSTSTVTNTGTINNAVLNFTLQTGYVGSAGTNGFQGSFGMAQAFNTQSGTTYSLVLADAGNLINLTNASGCTVTIPPDSSVNFTIGQRLDLMQSTVGSISVTAASGVTLYSTDSPILNSQYSIGTLIKVGVNEWTFAGPATNYIGYTGSASTASGYTGSAGTIGSTGTVGFTGSTGTQGLIGFTGSTGTQGVIGFTGSASTASGYVGSRGSTPFVVAVTNEVGSVTTGTSKVTFRAPYALTLGPIPRASLSTISSSGLVTVDIKLNGTTILGTDKLSIDSNEKTSVTAATPTTLVTTSVADDAEFTIDVTAAGTGAAGLKVTLYYLTT